MGAANMPTIQVLLVDDHPIVRRGILEMLQRAPDIQVIAETGKGEKALDLMVQLSPDVVLLDMELPDIGGYEVIRRSREETPQVRILALSGHDDATYIREALKHGASGYLVKEEVPEFIIEAIRGVAAGEQGWISRRVAANWSEQMRIMEGALITNVEADILRRVQDGKTNDQIAVELGISPKTVERRLNSIFQKLNVSSRTEAAVYAIKNKLI
jgi:two-component system NarL family response regulator